MLHLPMHTYLFARLAEDVEWWIDELGFNRLLGSVVNIDSPGGGRAQVFFVNSLHRGRKLR